MPHAARVERLGSVEEQVEKELLEGSEISFDVDRPALGGFVQYGAALFELRRRGVDGCRERNQDIDRCGVDRLRPGDIERGPDGRIETLDLLEGSTLGCPKGGILGKPLLDALQVYSDGRQGIPNLVSQCRGELSHGCQRFPVGEFLERAPQALGHGVESPYHTPDFVIPFGREGLLEITTRDRVGRVSQPFQRLGHTTDHPSSQNQSGHGDHEQHADTPACGGLERLDVRCQRRRRHQFDGRICEALAVSDPVLAAPAEQAVAKQQRIEEKGKQ